MKHTTILTAFLALLSLALLPLALPAAVSTQSPFAPPAAAVAPATPTAPSAQEWAPAQWPILKHYDQDHLYQIALPLGGIGTGVVSLGGRGELRDWEIMNTAAKGFNTGFNKSQAPFFSIWVKDAAGNKQTRALLGPIYKHEYNNGHGSPDNNHSLPRFTSASFDASYPFGIVHLAHENMPVTVRVKGFNPLVPADADASSYPVAVLTYEVTNTTASPLEVSICGVMRNFIGRDGSVLKKNPKRGWQIPQGAQANANQYRKGKNIEGIFMHSKGVPKTDAAWGTIALTTNSPGAKVTHSTSAVTNQWSSALLDFWDDFSDDGEITEKTRKVDPDPMAMLAVKKTIPANSTRTFTFFITWHFPNRKIWYEDDRYTTNYYTTQFTDAWDVAEKFLPRLPELERKTLSFVNAFLASDYPAVVKEAALFNLSTLRSQTVFRIPSGHLMGWEGTSDLGGSCHGNCTHVWNYNEQECGHHYVRSMAAWSLPVALSGFRYSAVDKSMHFTDTPGQYFWSTGYAWGACRITETQAQLQILHGELEIKTFTIGSRDSYKTIKVAPAGIKEGPGDYRIIRFPPESNPEEYTTYPFDEIGGIYDIVFGGMTEVYFKAFPDLDKEHTRKMQDFITAEYPREKFIKQMIREEFLPQFQKAAQDPSHRNTKEFDRAFGIVVNVSVPISQMVIGGLRDIYTAKYIEKNPAKLELFEMAQTEDEIQYVSWVSGEVSQEEAAKELGKEYTPKKGDKVFAFCSPGVTWTKLYGRQGYIIVRDGKILKAILTLMN